MRISILGCGWLGFPLAQFLLNEEYEVKGSTTSPGKLLLLQQAGIEPFLINVPSSLNEDSNSLFWETDLLFLNIPPGRNRENIETDYPSHIRQIVEEAEKHSLSWILFASSTSVYSATGGITREDDAEPGKASRPSGEALLKAEEIVRGSTIDSTILRFGGLYGYDRHPVKYLSGKKNLGDPLKPVNLVHQSDCVRVIAEIIRQKSRNEIYNVVSDGHPPRKEFYTSAAAHFGLPLPEFKHSPQKNYRVVSNEKLKKDLNFTFFYPNPMDHTP